MPKPDATLHNPDPTYLRSLIAGAGISQRRAADLVGVSPRMMRYYLQAADHPTHRPAPYAVQYCLEQL